MAADWSKGEGGSAPVEPDRLDRLLQLAGPVDGPELLRRLRQDLAELGNALAADWKAADRAGIRARTHALISVAGAIGACGLEHEARVLNDLANDPARPLPDSRLRALQARLAEALSLVEAHSSAWAEKFGGAGPQA